MMPIWIPVGASEVVKHKSSCGAWQFDRLREGPAKTDACFKGRVFAQFVVKLSSG
jgi:hypothetical protein